MQTKTIINRFLVDKDAAENSLSSVSIEVPFRIGRLEGFDLCLPSPNVSALHAEILEEDGELWLYDLGSTNGTFVNQERVRVKTQLRDNDTIVFGNRKFRLIQSTSSALGTRQAMATDADCAVSTETPEERFQRLLETGAVPFFQPVYEIANVPQHLVGYEVLGRSRIPGLRTPNQMFAAALPLKMEAELSRVFRHRGIMAADKKLPEDLKLFVNTHPAELNYNDLEESLEELREGFPTRPIVMELSETILNKADSYSKLLKILSNLDIGLALHDFGSGTLYLNELNEMTPDIVKFDCALMQGISKASSTQQRLVRAMVKMVQELGITPMAEFIESVDDHETLCQMGFAYAQGFHYGRPKNIKSITASPTESLSVAKSSEEAASDIPAKSETRNSKTRNPKPSAVELMDSLAKQKKAKQKETDSATGNDAEAFKTSLDNGRFHDANWLIRQPEDHYTIQLMMSPSRSSAENFVAKQNVPGDYAVYHKAGNPTTWFTVLYGVFKDRKMAELKSESFKQAGVAPLIRRFSSVQNEVNKMLKRDTATSKNLVT